MKAGARNRWVALACGAALAVALFLHFFARSDLWLDEALSVDIARLPLSDLRGALERDGAPPLYYVLLHFWMLVFGEGDFSVRALSGVFSVATLPALYIAGRRLGGRTAAWAAVLLLASSPFAIRYATETRMYALVMFLVAWGYLALVFALERPSLGRLALVALDVGLLLYAHNWSWYLLATVGVLMVLRAWRGATAEARHAARRVLVAMVVGGLLYVPWLPTLKYQLAHTGTPWGDARSPWSGVVAAWGAFAGIAVPIRSISFLLLVPLVLLPLLALFGAAVDGRRIELDLATRPTVRWEAIVAFGALLLGLTLSYLGGTAFDGRYTSVVFPLFVLVTAIGVTVFTNGALRLTVLGVVVVLGLLVGGYNATDNRTQAGEIASVITAEAKPGDLVLYCPDQLGPSVHRLLGKAPRLDEVTFPDLARPELVNWVDYRDRITSTDPAAVAKEVLGRAGGHTVWFVESTNYRSLEGKCEGIDAALGAAHPFTTVRRITANATDDFEFMGLVESRAP